MQDAIQQTKVTYPYTFQITEHSGNAWLFSQDIQIVSKYSWSDWNNQAPPGVLQLFKLCAAVSSSRFLYKLKKITRPIIPFFKSHPANFLFPIRFHRLRSWTMSQYKNKTLIYNNCTLSCLFFYVHRCIKTHGWKWQAAVTWFSSFFLFLEHVRHDETVTKWNGYRRRE